jgi:hypothetical protein
VATAGLATLAAASLLSLTIAPLPQLIRAVLAIAVVAISAFAIWRHASVGSATSIVSIQPMREGKCVLEESSGECIDGTILPDSVAWPWLLLLRFAVSERRWSVVVLILRDSMTETDWRQMSIWLRWQANALHVA